MPRKASTRIIWISAIWCLVSILVGIGIGKLSKDIGYQTLHDEVSDRLLASIHRVRGALNEFHYLPFLLTQNEDVIQLVNKESPKNKTEIAAKVSRYLEQTNLVAGASGLFIINQQGQTVAYSNWRDQLRLSHDEFAKLPLLQLAEQGEEGRFYENRPDQQAFYYLSAPIYKKSKFSGAAIVRIDLEKLLPDSPPDELFTISDDNQAIFMASPKAWIGKHQDHIAQASDVLLHNGATARLWYFNKQHYMTQKVRLDDLGWTFTTLVSAQANERYANLLSAITIAALWILGVILLYLRERRLKHHSQQETRAALARNEEQQRSIINNAEVGLLTLNAKGQIRFINTKAAQQFGFPVKQIIGHSFLSFLNEVTDESPLAQSLASLGQRNFIPATGVEVNAKHSESSSFPALISLREMHQNPDYDYLATVVDIGRRKQLEQALIDANESLEHKVQERTQALENAQEELIQSSKMAALGHMSTAIVHELNQPLTAMRTYIAISRQLLHEPELLQENLTLLNDLTQRMAAITSQLKTFAYKKPENVMPVSLYTAISQTQILMRRRFEEEHIQLDIDNLNPEHTVLGDNARIEQVLVNLISNACDALKDQSEKCIRIQSQPLNNEKICLIIEDNGPGISDDQKAQLFEPFYTTKPMGSGLGLGLAIVNAIVRDLQGSIYVKESDLGGASFVITLNMPAN